MDERGEREANTRNRKDKKRKMQKENGDSGQDRTQANRRAVEKEGKRASRNRKHGERGKEDGMKRGRKKEVTGW